MEHINTVKNHKIELKNMTRIEVYWKEAYEDALFRMKEIQEVLRLKESEKEEKYKKMFKEEEPKIKKAHQGLIKEIIEQDFSEILLLEDEIRLYDFQEGLFKIKNKREAIFEKIKVYLESYNLEKTSSLYILWKAIIKHMTEEINNMQNVEKHAKDHIEKILQKTKYLTSRKTFTEKLLSENPEKSLKENVKTIFKVKQNLGTPEDIEKCIFINKDHWQTMMKQASNRLAEIQITLEIINPEITKNYINLLERENNLNNNAYIDYLQRKYDPSKYTDITMMLQREGLYYESFNITVYRDGILAIIKQFLEDHELEKENPKYGLWKKLIEEVDDEFDELTKNQISLIFSTIKISEDIEENHKKND